MLVRGDVFADALVAGAVARFPARQQNAGAVLLTERDELPAVTRDTLRDLGIRRVILVGGTAAISSSLERQLATTFTVERVGGVDRYETSALAALRVGQDNLLNVPDLDDPAATTPRRTAFVANGVSGVDALATGGVAPVLLVPPTGVPESVRIAVEELNIQQIGVLGGTTAVPAGVERQFDDADTDTARIAGDHRFGTAVAFASNPQLNAEEPLEDVGLARGDVFADALTANRAPLLLTLPDRLPDVVRAFLDSRSDQIRILQVYGGQTAVSDSVVGEAREAAQTVANDPR